MRPEAALLLCFARLRLTEEETARAAALLRRCRDWTYLRRTAGRHGMLPLLYWHLRNFDGQPDRLPPDFMFGLQEHFHSNAKRNLYLTGELIKLLRLFRSNGVPCLAFKGPVQAASLYGNVALREFVDLDILARERDLPKFTTILAGESYAPQIALHPAQDRYYQRTHCERNFARSDGRSFVDLHWAITDDHFRFALGTDELLGRLEEKEIGGVRVGTLASEDLLLVLSVHAAKDLFSRLESLCAVAELVRSRELDWPLALGRAAETLSSRRLLLTLALARDLLDAPLPREVLDRIEGGKRWLAPLALEARARLFREGKIGVLERSRWNFRVLDRKRDGLGGVAKSIYRPNLPDWDALPLPAPLSFLYYLVRPLRLVRKYLRTSLRRGQ